MTFSTSTLPIVNFGRRGYNKGGSGDDDDEDSQMLNFSHRGDNEGCTKKGSGRGNGYKGEDGEDGEPDEGRRGYN
jgi:hypothetical protein